MELWTPNGPRKRMAPATFNAPLRWQANPWTIYIPKILWGTLGDPFDPAVPIQDLADALDVVRRCDQLDWWIVTKRIGLWRDRVNRVVLSEFGTADTRNWLRDWCEAETAPSHVRLGVSISDQPTADKLIPELLRVPAANYFVLIEPLIGGIALRLSWLRCLDNVIVGGETGPHARPCNVDGIRDIIRQCRSAGVKCYVKQLGNNAIGTYADHLSPCHSRTGSDPAEWPEDLRVTEI